MTAEKSFIPFAPVEGLLVAKVFKWGLNDPSYNEVARDLEKSLHGDAMEISPSAVEKASRATRAVRR